MKQYVILRFRSFVLLLAGTILSIGMSLYLVTGVSAKDNTQEDPYSELKTFTDVLGLVEKNYVEKVDISKLIEGSVKGMVQTLDPHSGYMNKETYKELQVETKGEFGGLGIEITVKDNLITVVSPIEDSPAYRAGIQPGDQIIKIGDEFTRDLTLVDAVKKMRGPKGSPITISVHREGQKELLPLTVIRDIIKVKSVRYRDLEDNIGYIRLAQFQEGSSVEFNAALKSLTDKAKDKKLKGLILDLRNDPGGLLNEAVRVSDIFLKDGLVVYTDGRLESQKTKYYAHDDGTEPDFPMIVLVNGGSASASEIVSGALQDAGRAVILGTQSFGKGSVQTILPMDNGGGLRLTTALYYTRNGRSIQAQGITPDVIVSAKRFPGDKDEVLDEEGIPTKERDLPGAFKNPLKKEDEEKNSGKTSQQTETKKPTDKSAAEGEEDDRVQIGSRKAMEADLPTLLRDDPQLAQALRLLKTWHVFKGKPVVSGGEVLPPSDSKANQS